MSKIKNWTKVAESQWRHDISKRFIMINYDNSSDEYMILIEDYDGAIRPYDNYFRSYKYAKESVITYMRSHPNG